MYARLTTAAVPVEAMKDLRQTMESVVTRTKEIPGVKKFYGLADETTGKIVAIALYETEGELVASREAAIKIREEVVKATGGTISSVEEFEVIGQS
jgi:hypothetical protein